MFFIVFAFKGQVHVFAGRVKLLSPAGQLQYSVTQDTCKLTLSPPVTTGHLLLSSAYVLGT